VKPIKLLIVDDDSNILDALELVLTTAGYETRLLQDGRETLAAAKEYRPDMILLDVLMSGVDGKDLCKRLKKDSDLRKIPLIMISAHPSAKQHVLNCGADTFLAKPFNARRLLQVLEKYTPKRIDKLLG
jgi:DNA-binding response OmpR family regulator